MDTSPDSRTMRTLCALTCPFCKKCFILTTVYNTHLLAHVNYHSNSPFACTICDFRHKDIVEVTTHIETFHSVKYRIETGSPLERQILADNEEEKSQIILLLSRMDNPALPLSLPY